MHVNICILWKLAFGSACRKDFMVTKMHLCVMWIINCVKESIFSLKKLLQYVFRYLYILIYIHIGKRQIF